MKTSELRIASFVILAWTGALLVFIFAVHGALILCFKDARSWRGLWSASRDPPKVKQAVLDKDLQFLLRPWTNRRISYERFLIDEPRFSDEKDDILFRLNNEHAEIMAARHRKELLGQIQVIHNGTVHRSYDCGWNMDVAVFSSTPKGRIRRRFKVMIPLLVPQSNSFQHFLDGVVPKLVQASSLLDIPNITVMIYRPWDPIITEIMARFGIRSDMIHFYDNGYYSAEYLVNACVTPPIHPQLWQHARTRLGASEQLPVPLHQANVILLTRTKSRNTGRRVDNMNELVTLLKSRYGENFKMFQGGYRLKDVVTLFGKARIIIGVHGGAFYNMFLSPIQTHVVEIIPTHDNGTFVPVNVAYNIVWKMANMLNQPYWRISERPLTVWGDVRVNVNKLRRVLDAVDKDHGLQEREFL